VERLEVRALLTAPIVANAIADQIGAFQTPFQFTVPSNTFTDADAGDTLTLTATGVPPGLTFTPGSASANPTGDFSGTPSVVGTFNVTVTATDSTSASVFDTFKITIPPNAVPRFTKGANQAALEDGGAQTVTNWATNISQGLNESGQTVNFVVSNDNTGLFSVQPVISVTGELTYTPAANANGTTTVTVFLHDDAGTLSGGVDTSAAQTFTITVTAVNDLPSFAVGANQTALEDSGAQSVSNFATSISAGVGDTGQTVDFLVSNDTPALFSVQPAISASGTLTYTPASNANGTATVTVRIHDNGGTANGGVDTSDVQTFTITITTTTIGATITDANPVYRVAGNVKLRAVVIDGLLNVQFNGVPQRFFEPSVIETLTFIGGSKNDEIDLTGLDDAEYSNPEFNVVIKSGAGNDRLVGSFASDSIDAGSGNDTLTGGDGNDTLIGGAGTDRLVETATANLTLNDTSLTELGTDRLVTLETAELTADDMGRAINASTFKRGAVTLIGGAGNDTLIGGSRNDAISGRDGDDSLSGGLGNDTILGGFGEDTLNGDDGNDLLIGGFDDDTINGGIGRDTVAGGNGGAARGGDGVADVGDDLSANPVSEINEVFKKLFAFE